MCFSLLQRRHRSPGASPSRCNLVCWFCAALLALTFSASAAVDPVFYGEWKTLQNRCLKAMQDVRNAEGKTAAEEFVAKALETFGEKHDFTATALHWLALFTQHTDDMVEAEKLWWRALAVDEALHGVNSLESSRRLFMLGGFYREKGDLQRSHDLFHRALAIRQQKLGNDSELTANVLLDLARLSNVFDEIEKAEDYLRQALTIYEKDLAKGDPSASIMTAVLDLASVYLEIKDADAAERCVELLLQNEKRTTELPRWVARRGAEALGYVHEQRGEHSDAERFFKKNIALIQSDPSPHARAKGRDLLAYLPLINLHLRSGNVDAVEPLCKTVLEPLIDNKNIPWERRSWALRLLAEQKQHSGDYEGAERVLQKARSHMETFPATAPRERSLILAGLAKVQYALGDTNGAMSLARPIQDMDEHRLNEVLSFTSERQRLTYMATSDNEPFSLCASLGAVRPLARAVLRTKGLVLDTLIEDRSLSGQSGDDTNLLERVQHARNRIVDLNATFAAGTNSTKVHAERSESLVSAARELDSAESALARRATRVSRSRQALGVTLEQVQGAIPTNAVVVEVFSYKQYKKRGGRSERSYGALVLLRASEPRWVPLGSAAALDRKIQFYCHALRMPTEDEALNSILKELSVLIWQPIAAALPDGATNIIISPDSQLNFVSFAALTQSNGRFVGEDFTVSYISTARDLLEQTSPVRADRTLAVWASPDFREAPSQNWWGDHPSEPQPEKASPLVANRAAAVRELRGLQLDPLHGARWEGEQLKLNATRFGFTACQTFIGADATEAQLRRVSSPRVLHLATHGFFLPRKAEPARTGSEKTADSAIRTRLANNPMLRSGVALAGAQRTLEAWKRGESVPAGNDGIVTAEEVASLDLHDTLLVVLSACDTGGGEALAGEGVLGLRRGFIQAGAENLLVALWSVDDKATADFFLAFYKSLGAGLSPANALSQTQAHWLRRLRVEKGIAAACRTVGPFVLSSRGGPRNEPFYSEKRHD